MRKTILAMVGILVLGWAVVQGQTSTDTATELQQNTTEQVQLEEYVPRVIIEGKWGTEPGEFGRNYWMDEGEEYIYEPKSLAVDSKGNIFILDTVNNRIQKFDSEGKYLLSIPVDSFKGEYNYYENKPLENPFMKGTNMTSPTEVKGINIVIDSQDNLYYYRVHQKANKGEVWQYKDDKLVRKWNVHQANLIRLIDDAVLIPSGNGYEELKSKKRYKNIREMHRKKGDIEVIIPEPEKEIPTKFITLKKKNKEVKIDISDNEYPLKEMSILPSGEILVGISKGKGDNFKKELYVYNENGKKVKKIVGIQYDYDHSKLRYYWFRQEDSGLQVLKYELKNK